MKMTRLYKFHHYRGKCLLVLVTLLLLLLILHHCSHVHSTLVLRTVYNANTEDLKHPNDAVAVALMSYLSLLNTDMDKQKFMLRS
jgi:hypothetical protein